MNDIKYESKNYYNNLFAKISITQGYTEKETYDLIKKLDYLNYHIMIDDTYTPVFIYNNSKNEVVHRLKCGNTIQDAFVYMDSVILF